MRDCGATVYALKCVTVGKGVKDISTSTETKSSISNLQTTQPTKTTISTTITTAYSVNQASSKNTPNPGSKGSQNSSQDKGMEDETIVLIAAVGIVAMIIIAIAGYMVKSKCQKNTRGDGHVSTSNLQPDDEVNIYPDNKGVASRMNFQSDNLFQFDSKEEMYSRPPSATSMRRDLPTNNLSSIYDQQHLDKLFSVNH